MAFHGVPRTTKDIDILVNPSIDNIKRIIKALDQFGFSSLEIKEEDLTKRYSIRLRAYC